MVQGTVSDRTRQEQPGIPQITKFQYLLLRRVANSTAATGTYVAISSVVTDRYHEKIDADFAAAAELVTLDLFADISSYPAFKEIMKTYKEEQGRVVRIYQLTPNAQQMFERTGDPWANHLN